MFCSYVQVFLKTSTALFKAVKGTTEKIQVQLIVKKKLLSALYVSVDHFKTDVKSGSRAGFQSSDDLRQHSGLKEV